MSVKQLLKDAWDNLKRVWVQLLVLHLAVFGVGILIALLLVVVLGAGLLANLGTLSTNPAAALGLIGPFALIILVFVIGFIVLSLIVQGATILILGTSQKYSLGDSLRAGLKLAPSLFALGFLGFLITLPAFFLFIIPGILVAFFFMFSSYELVLGNRPVVESLKRSAYLVKNNFGFVFWRALLIIGLGFLLSIATANLGGGVVSWIVGMVFGWFASSYVVVLYKYLEGATKNKDQGQSLVPFVVLAIVGYLAAGLLAYSVVKLVGNSDFREVFNQGLNQQIQTELQEEGISDEFMSAYREQFVASCAQEGQSAEYCECVADTLIENYNTEELTRLSLQVLQEGTYPQEFQDAAASCNP